MAKGSSFERKIAVELSAWYSKGKRDDIFWRSTTSGARATIRMRKGKQTADGAGDLMAIHESGKSFTKDCVIEIKRGYNRKKSGASQCLSVLSLLDFPVKRKTKPLLFRWWEKIEFERNQHERKHSWIIFRRDRCCTCICMSKSSFMLIESKNKKRFIFPKNGTYVEIQRNGYHLIMFLLDDFLKWCNPNIFRKEKIIRKIKRR